MYIFFTTNKTYLRQNLLLLISFEEKQDQKR